MLVLLIPRGPVIRGKRVDLTLVLVFEPDAALSPQRHRIVPIFARTRVAEKAAEPVDLGVSRST
jgi:hypothetical protein